VAALADLALLTGNIGRKGGGVYALQRANNAQGACDMGTIPRFLPGYLSVTDAPAREKFEKHWGASLPAEAGLTTLEMMEQARQGNIKGMYIVGENPMLSFPNSRHIAEALASLDFLVVQDMFLTETAKLANVILPAASFAEREGTFTNFEGRVNRLRKAIEPVGESLPDWQIIVRVADKMNCALPFSCLENVMSEIEELVPSYEAYTSSERQDDLAYGEAAHTSGRPLLKGFARFSTIEYRPQAQARKPGYPYTLLTGGTLYHFGTGTRSSRARRLRTFSPRSFVEMCEDDAKKLAVADGDEVKVISAVGDVTTTVKTTDTLSSGMLFMPFSFPEAPVNGLFDIILDPETKSPSLKACKVRVEKSGAAGGQDKPREHLA
jgi:predicted molibdopterin-dependent oxidoreductase YjgC